MDEAKLAAERATGTGGSDAASVMADKLIDTWGCRHRFQLDKRGVPKDFANPTPAMHRGIILEPIIRDEYMAKTGRYVERTSAMYRSEKYPWMICHPDGYVNRQVLGGSIGVWEAKCIGRYSYEKYKKSGLSEDYQLQMQHNMLVMRRSWGSFAIQCVDPWELSCFDVEADPGIQAVLIKEEEKAWNEIANCDLWAPKLDPKDRRCKSCFWRKTCQGIER